MVDSNNALSLKFVPEKINSAILSEGEFLDKGIYIKKSEIKDSNDQPYYICKITRAKHSYIGLLNPLFQRENLGVNKYYNGDYYVGYWVNNTKAYSCTVVQLAR